MPSIRRFGATILWTTALALAGAALTAGAARAEMSGKQLIERKGCLNCHSLLGRGATVGPPLQTTPAWSPPDRMRKYIKDPRSVNPSSIMLQIPLTDEEIEAIVTYLQSFKDTAEAPEGWKPE